MNLIDGENIVQIYLDMLLEETLTSEEFYVILVFMAEWSRSRLTQFLIDIIKSCEAENVKELFHEFSNKLADGDKNALNLISEIARDREIIEIIQSKYEYYFSMAIKLKDDRVFSEDEYQTIIEKIEDSKECWLDAISSGKLESEGKYFKGKYWPEPEIEYDKEANEWELKSVPASLKRIEKLGKKEDGQVDIGLGIKKFGDDFRGFKTLSEAQKYYEKILDEIQSLGADSPHEKFILAKIFGF
jgi:hypothetical protein